MNEIVRGTARTTEEPPAEADAPAIAEFLAFDLDGQLFALPLGSIREILRTIPITHVPRAPVDVLGVVSVRGTITTVMSPRRRLSLGPAKEVGKRSRILLVDNGDEIVGVQVDRVASVIRLERSQIEPSKVIGAELSDVVYGIGRPWATTEQPGDAEADSIDPDEERDDDIVVLLDPTHLLR